LLFKSLVSTDHKVFGLLYAVTSLFFLLVGFMLVILIRGRNRPARRALERVVLVSN